MTNTVNQAAFDSDDFTAIYDHVSVGVTDIGRAMEFYKPALATLGLEPVMDSGGGGHSVFAKAFLAALQENDGVLEGQELFNRLRRPVVVNSDQTPDYSDIRRAGHDGGDFLFVRR